MFVSLLSVFFSLGTDKRFADGCQVEFVFSATGNFVTGEYLYRLLCVVIFGVVRCRAVVELFVW